MNVKAKRGRETGRGRGRSYPSTHPFYANLNSLAKFSPVSSFPHPTHSTPSLTNIIIYLLLNTKYINLFKIKIFLKTKLSCQVFFFRILTI